MTTKRISDLGYATPLDGTEMIPVMQAGTTAKTTVVQVLKANQANLPINVKEYGAVGDGTTDDTAAIQSAITSLTNGGGIYFPSGTYLTGSLIGYGNCAFQGAGARISVLKLKPAQNTSLLSSPDDGVQRYGMSIRNLGFNGQASLQTSGLAPLIDVRGMSEPVLSDLYITNPRGPGIHFGQATAGIYTTVPMLDRIVMRGDATYSQSHGIFFDSGSSDVLVSQCDIGFFGAGAGISFSGHNGATVSNTNTWQCRYGLQFYQSNRMRISGCLSDYAKYHGFIAQESSDLGFDNCQSREYGIATVNTYDGFHFEGISGTQAQNIILTGCRAMSTQGRVGVSLQQYLSYVRVVGGSLVGQNVSTMVVGTGVADYRFLAVAGVTDVAG